MDSSLADVNISSGRLWNMLVQPNQNTVQVRVEVETLQIMQPLTYACLLDRWHTLQLVDLVRFNSDGKIAAIREYFDTRLIHDLVREHEANQGKTKEQSAE